MKKKLLSLVLVVGVCCTLLTGCMGQIMESVIREDGSGTIHASVGFTEETMLLLSSMSEEEADMSEYIPFVYDGKTYYGQTTSIDFASVEEFNSLMADVSEGGDLDVDTGFITLDKNADGEFVLTMMATSETGDTTSVEEELKSYEDMMQSDDMEFSSDLTEEDMEALLAGMKVVFSFEFPRSIKQISGTDAGITIDGNKLTLDIIDMSMGITEDTIFRFTTDMDAEFKEIEHFVVFDDVASDKWYYDAVQAMADGGLVAGVGNGKFLPEATLTRAQFYQILARATGLVTGTVDNYWAAGAINSCIYEGFVKEYQEYLYDWDWAPVINRVDWDVPITREEAVAALTLARVQYPFEADELPQEVIVDSIEDIPDYKNISDLYAEEIVEAFNYGITSGVDANKTFVPKGLLTRAQGCQLFYNLGWTTPMN